MSGSTSAEERLSVTLALLLGVLTTLANIAGSALAVVQRQPSREFMSIAIAFGGGFMLATAFLEMGPEAIKEGEYMPAFIALGFLLLYLTEHLFNVHIHHIPEGSPQTQGYNPHPLLAPGNPTSPADGMIASSTGMAAFVGFNLHDFIDGLAIGAAMITSQAVGVLVFLAVLLHEVPAGFAMAAILRGSGRSRVVALLSGVSIGVVTLVGIAVPFLVGGVSSVITGVFLAMATGSFIYLGASILIPAAETGGFRWSFLFVALGFFAFYGSSELVGLFL